MNQELQEHMFDKVYCPHCGAPIWSAKQYFIDWDDANRQFKVQMAFYCPPCSYRFEETVKNLPLEISMKSNCKCGAKLELLDYKLRRIEDDVEFEAVYKCKECERRERTFLSKIKKGLTEIWYKTSKIQIGPEGISYEKKS